MNRELVEFRTRLISKLEKSKEMFATYEHVRAGVIQQRDHGEFFPSVALSIRFLDATPREPDGIQLTVTSEFMPSIKERGITAYIMYTDESGEVVADFNDGKPVKPSSSCLAALLEDLPRLIKVLKECVISKHRPPS